MPAMSATSTRRRARKPASAYPPVPTGPLTFGVSPWASATQPTTHAGSATPVVAARTCRLPVAHRGWWYAAPASGSASKGASEDRTAGADGVPGEVICGLCEYPGISPDLRRVLASETTAEAAEAAEAAEVTADGAVEPVAGMATAETRDDLAARLLVWGAAHGWPRLPLTLRTGPGVYQEPYCWLCAGEASWRTFARGDTVRWLRLALGAAAVA